MPGRTPKTPFNRPSLLAVQKLTDPDVHTIASTDSLYVPKNLSIVSPRSPLFQKITVFQANMTETILPRKIVERISNDTEHYQEELKVSENHAGMLAEYAAGQHVRGFNKELEYVFREHPELLTELNIKRGEALQIIADENQAKQEYEERQRAYQKRKREEGFTNKTNQRKKDSRERADEEDQASEQSLTPQEEQDMTDWERLSKAIDSRGLNRREQKRYDELKENFGQ